MGSQELSLDEISDATGVERRTLRSWVAEGLLAPPSKAGRGATYPASNVDRALAVRALQDVHGLQLAEIRKRLMLADEAQIRAWAAEGRQPRFRLSSARDYLRGIDRGRADPKAEYLRRLRDESSAALHEPPEAPWPGAGKKAPEWQRPADKEERWQRKKASVARDLAGIEALVVVLEAAVRVPPGRRARGSEWIRIPITPDMELMVRGELAPPDRATLERVADLIRAILTGGISDDDT